MMNEYVDERAMTKEDVKDKVKNKFLDVNKKMFIEKYGIVLKYLTNLQHGTLHKKRL
jgi:hypothetical protein